MSYIYDIISICLITNLLLKVITKKALKLVCQSKLSAG